MSLEIRNVTKRFGELKALDDVSITIGNGSLVCFLGPSGCGKTTLLRVIAGLEPHDAGELSLDGRDLSRIPARNRNFGVVFQSYSLFPNMTIAANVAYGLECRGWSRKDIARRVEEMLSLVHLNDQAGKHPHQLSGGRQQRIALARALYRNPRLLVLDEPDANLDDEGRQALAQAINTARSNGNLVLLISHRPWILKMADIVIQLEQGRLKV